MRLARIVIASVFVLVVAPDAVAQEWVVDRVVQPSHYTQNETFGNDASEHDDILLVAAQAEEEDWVELKSGMTVPNDSVIRTGQTGRLQLRRGEEIMQFKPETMASVLMWEHDGSTLTYIEQTMGSLLLDVETRETKHTMVETPYLAAVVKGTRFTVQFGREQATLRVEHGVVEAIDVKRNERVDVHPQQSVRLLESSTDPMTIEGPGAKDEVSKIPFQFFSRERRKGSLLDDAAYDRTPVSDVVAEPEESEAAFEFPVNEPELLTDNDLAPETGAEGVLSDEDAASVATGSSEMVPNLLTTEEALSQNLEDEATFANSGVLNAAASQPPISSAPPMEARPILSNRDPLIQWQAALSQTHHVLSGHGDIALHGTVSTAQSSEEPQPSYAQNQALGGESEMLSGQNADADNPATAAANAPIGQPKDNSPNASPNRKSDGAPLHLQPHESKMHTMVDQELEAEKQAERQAARKAKRLAVQGMDGDASMIGDEPHLASHQGAAANSDRVFYVFETESMLSGDDSVNDLESTMDGVFQLIKPDPIRIWLDSATIISLIETDDPFLALLQESSKHNFAERFWKIRKGILEDALFGFTAVDKRVYGYRHLMHDFGQGFLKSPQELVVTLAPIPIPNPALLLLSAVLSLRICRVSIWRK